MTFGPRSSPEAPARPAAVVQSCFRGCIAPTAWPRDEAAALLPDDLLLRSADGEAANLIFLFGEQTQCAALLGQIPAIPAADYREMLIAVDGVRHRDGGPSFVYIACGYSDSALTVFNGNQFYGFAKQPARLWWQPPFFLVTDDSERLLWQAQMEPDEERRPSPAWEKLHHIFRQPIVGRTRNALYVASYFDWDLSNGTQCGASVRLTREDMWTQGVTQREWISPPGNAVWLNGLRWRLTWPTPLRY